MTAARLPDADGTGGSDTGSTPLIWTALVIAFVADGDDRSGADRFAAGLLDDHCILDHLGQVGDAPLHLPLFFFRSVIVAVLREVAELTGRLDLPGDVDPSDGGELVILGFQAIKSCLGELLRLCHAREGSGSCLRVGPARATLVPVHHCCDVIIIC